MPGTGTACGWETNAGWLAGRALTRLDGYHDEAPVPQLRDLSPVSSRSGIISVAGVRPLFVAPILIPLSMRIFEYTQKVRQFARSDREAKLHR
jgi:hypothetical protein